MKTKIKILCLIFTIFISVIFVFSTLANDDFAKIRIVSFNIAELGEGEHHLKRDEKDIARILYATKPDVVAIQEVGVKEGGKKQFFEILKYLNEFAEEEGNTQYCGIVTTYETGDERYAFIWKNTVEKSSEIHLMDDTNAYKGSVFVRTPVYCYFKAGNFDFGLMNVHLYTWIQKNSKGRKHEYKQLVEWIKAMSEGEEKDYIIVGDFNRHLNGRSFPKVETWETIAFDGFEEIYRFVLLESIPGGIDVKKAPEDKYSTTETKRLAIYDQIIISKGSFREFGENATWGSNVGVVDFDNEAKYSEISTMKLKYIISDHRPIWADFRIDLEDDD